MKKQNKLPTSSPEKKIASFAGARLKRLFLIIASLITYWQLYEYISESPAINVCIEETSKAGNRYETQITLSNGSEAIISNDVVKPIKIHFKNKFDSITQVKSVVQTKILTSNKTVSINFDLLNTNEQLSFILYSHNRPEITKISYRIKNIENVQFYDFQLKPKPLNRILNVWLVIFVLSIFFFIDALLVVIKDMELGDIKHFIYHFPLNKTNQEEFIKGYEKVYDTYRLRLKPPADFMAGIMSNLFISFPHKTEDDFRFIRAMANFKTELYTLYRVRSSFLALSPTATIASILALVFNYFYYEIDFINNNISLDLINKILLTIILIVTILVILFPRRVMTLMFVKKGGIKF